MTKKVAGHARKRVHRFVYLIVGDNSQGCLHAAKIHWIFWVPNGKRVGASFAVSPIEGSGVPLREGAQDASQDGEQSPCRSRRRWSDPVDGTRNADRSRESQTRSGPLSVSSFVYHDYTYRSFVFE